MATPCGVIIYYLAHVTGLIGLASYYGLTSNAPALPSAHIGTVIATQSVQAILNTFAPTVHHTLRIDAPPPPALSVTLYPVKPKFSAPATFVLSPGESIVSYGTQSTSVYDPFWILPQLLTGILFVFVLWLLLYVSADYYTAIRERYSNIIAGKLAEWSSRCRNEIKELESAKTTELNRIKDEHSNAYSEEKRNHETRLAKLREQNSAEEDRINNDHTTNMNKRIAEHSEEIRNHDTKMAELRAQISAEADQLKTDHSTGINNAKEAHSAEVDKLTNDHSSAINALKDEHSEEKRDLDTKMAQLRQEVSAEEDKLKMHRTAEIINDKDAHSAEKDKPTDNNFSEAKSLRPSAATFTPAADRSATPSNISSTIQVNETESVQASVIEASPTNLFKDEPVPVNTSALKAKMSFKAPHLKRNGMNASMWADFTPAADRDAAVSDISSNTNVDETENMLHDANKPPCKPSRDGNAALAFDVASYARSISQDSTKPVNKAEKGQAMKDNNMYNVLNDEQPDLDCSAAPTDIRTGGDMQGGYHGNTDVDNVETSQWFIDGPAGSVDMNGDIDDSGWQEANPKKRRTRGKRAGVANREKQRRYEERMKQNGWS